MYVFADERGHIKIGWAKSVRARLEQIAVGNPYKVRLAYSRDMPMPLARAVERAVHAIFRDRRTVQGTIKEWFVAEPEEAAAAIERLAGEIELADCSVGAYDRPRNKTEIQVSFRLPAEIAETFQRLADLVYRPLPNFLRLTLIDAATGDERLLREVREAVERDRQ